MADVPNWLTPKQTETIWRKLLERGVRQNCPMCKSGGPLSLLDGFFAPEIVLESNDAWKIGGQKRIFPTCALVCQNCGFTSSFSLGSLGLMDLFAKDVKADKGGKE